MADKMSVECDHACMHCRAAKTYRGAIEIQATITLERRVYEIVSSICVDNKKWFRDRQNGREDG